MKLKNGKSVNHVFHAAAILPTAVLSVGLAMPASKAYAAIATPDEIIVTARRTEEVTQNVPIAMTVFNQEMLTERNVTNGADLVNFTPSLSVNKRFGSDQASFAIRGFTQELRTTASVAVYFADVVAPRGSGNITSGDGAGPGAFFDLQNVQVLKGPQGTLFGRNTTGGAIQLVPQEPTSQLEGYLELSGGNYDLRRIEGVVNVPISDNVRARFGLDKMTREGYLKNASGIGPDRLADVDYIAGRAGVIVEIGDSVENYSIFTYADSKNNGSVGKLFACSSSNAGLLAFLAPGCRTALAAREGDDFYTVHSAHADPESSLKQWQFINTTTWDVNDDLTIKNILSYADLEQRMASAVFGADITLNLAEINPFLPSTNLQNFVSFNAPSWLLHGKPSNSQTTFIEEIQASGTAFDDKLTWQAGVYYENSKPDGWVGSQAPGMVECGYDSLEGDPSTYGCTAGLYGLSAQLDPFFTGFVQENLNQMEYLNQAVYSQATYDFSDEWRATLGLRYTVDETDAKMKSISYGFPTGTSTCVNTGAAASDIDQCLAKEHTKSEAPTWLIDVDYLPTPDVMIYAKYARGYRQGNIVTAATPEYRTYEPEEVDAYEIGAKTSFRSVVQGTFNIAVFYNEIKDQQLQVGLTPLGQGRSPTSGIVNAGSATIQGVDLETTLKLFDGLAFNLGYTYLETHLDSADFPTSSQTLIVTPAAVEGEHLTFSPRHTVVTGLSYTLPLPKEVGDVSVGANYTFTSEQNSSSPSKSAYAVLPVRQIVNLYAGWKSIYGSPFDLSLFATNVLDEEYYAYVNGVVESMGSEYGVTGEPRMYGARVKYNF